MISQPVTGIRKVNVINRRMFILSAAKVLVFSGIIARLFSLQISENKKYLTLSDKNRLREWRLPPVRGDFLDYFNLKNLVELPPLNEIRDFDKINEELELEDVGSGGDEADAKEGDEASNEVALENNSDVAPEEESIVDSVVEGKMLEAQAPGTTVSDSVEEDGRAEEGDGGLGMNEGEPTQEEPTQEAVEEKAPALEEKPAVSSLADIVRQFEANKAQEAEVDASDDAVATEAQLEEDLMLAEIVERQLENGGEVSVGDLSVDEGEE